MTHAMSVADAAYHTVHDYQGGASALQVRLGKSNLSAEVSPNNPAAKLGLVDAVRIQAMTGDYRILNAMAIELGHYPPQMMPIEGAAAVTAQAGHQALSNAAKEFGDVVTAVAGALADDIITPNEHALITKECGELIVKLQELIRTADALCPSRVRASA